MLRTSKLLMKIHDAGTGLLCSLSEPFEGYEGTGGTIKCAFKQCLPPLSGAGKKSWILSGEPIRSRD